MTIDRCRGKSDTAIAHHHRGNTVPGRRCHLLVPGRLTIVVGVYVDEAGRDVATRGIKLRSAGPQVTADSGYPVAIDRHIGDEGLAACAINNGPTPDHQIMHVHHSLFLYSHSPT